MDSTSLNTLPALRCGLISIMELGIMLIVTP